jgi:lipoprotein signal peptidase
MPTVSTHTTAEQVAEVEPAIKSVGAHACFWLVATLSLSLDLWSKEWAFKTLPVEGFRPWIDGWVVFHRSLNDGAVFGSFTGYTSVFIVASLCALGFVFYLFARSGRNQWCLHIALAMILSGAIGNLYDRAYIVADVATIVDDDGVSRSMIGILLSDPDDKMVRIGSWPEGANPKRLDRDKYQVELRRQGVVRDFIRFVPHFPSWVPKLAGKEMWPWVFNVADAALVCGVGVLLLSSLFDGRKEHDEPQPQ